MSLVFIFGCGKSGHKTFQLPADTSTLQERQKISDSLDVIQNELRLNGVERELRSIKIVVADLEDKSVRGRCYQDMNHKPLGIVLTREMLAQPALDDNFYPWHFTVLLHEIGHCFFGREHEDEMLPLGHEEAIFPQVRGGPGKDIAYSMNQISPSVMNLKGDRMLLKVLAPYYIREVAGLERIHSLLDLRSYIQVETKTRF